MPVQSGLLALADSERMGENAAAFRSQRGHARAETGEEVGSPPISRVLSNATGGPVTSGSHSSGRHVAVAL